MKLKSKFLLLLTALAVVVSSCSKDNYDAIKQAAKDEALIVTFITKNKIQATKHESGLYYQILEEGTGKSISSSATVSATYVGKLLNGKQFDGSTATFSLKQVIKGWTIGVPLVKVGGSIRLIIPSHLAYGNNSPGAGIPKNAVLDFKVDLLNAE